MIRIPAQSTLPSASGIDWSATPSYYSLPFSAFRDAPECMAALVTVHDLHVASRGLDHAGLKSWPMIDNGRMEPHTSRFYVREWLDRRREDGTTA